MIVRPSRGPGPKKATAVLTRGERVIAFAEKFLRVPEGALVGQPIRLEEFQRKFILDVYDNPAGTSKAILSIARKNGKSAIIACILLAHLVGPEAKLNSQIVSGAMSRDQAALVFNLAVKMVQLSPDIRNLVHVSPSGKKLTGKPLNVEYKALSAEAATTHGLSPILAILDEIGQVRGPQSDFIDAVTTAQGAHDGKALVIAISTQAATDADLLSIWIDDALKSGDPRIVCHLYAADPDAELDDPKGWQAANPALGIFRSRQDVEQQAAEAKRMPSRENTFRNLILNQRVSTVSPFVSRDVWKSCAGAPEFVPGSQVFGGLDLSARTDLTAFVLIGRHGGKWHTRSYFWTPQEGLKDRARRDRVPYDVWAEQGYLRTTPGRTVDYEVVARDIAEICEDYTVHSIAYDRWRIDLLKKEFADLGIDADTSHKDGGRLPLVAHGQGFKDFSPALDALESELVNARVVHDDNPVLTMCASNAVVQKDPSGNRKLDKSKATGRIDGMVAMAMAHGATVLAASDLEPERTFQLLVF